MQIGEGKGNWEREEWLLQPSTTVVLLTCGRVKKAISQELLCSLQNMECIVAARQGQP